MSAGALAPRTHLKLRRAGSGAGVNFREAIILPDRGFMVYQLRAYVPGLGEIDLLDSPPLEEGLRRFEADGPGGAETFLMGAALLLPFANRVRGTAAGGRVRAMIDGHEVALIANGPAPRGAPCAIHGLALAARAETAELIAPHRLQGRFTSSAFSAPWLSDLVVEIDMALAEQRFEMQVRVTNVGAAAAPVGVGWHPYLRIPSGQRDLVRLRLPARSRLDVHDYVEVYPTGRLVDVAGSPYDFNAPTGAPLGELRLDDGFTNLPASEGFQPCADVFDPPSGLQVAFLAETPPVRCIQVYTPSDRPVICIEPQFNLNNPFGDEWAGGEAGMVRLRPGAATTYRVGVQLQMMN